MGQPGSASASYGMINSSYDMGVPNSPGERQVMSELVALRDRTTPSGVPAWSSMLVGPLYRGTELAIT